MKTRTLIALCMVTAVAVEIHAQSGRLRGREKAPEGQADKDKETVRLRAEEVLLPVSVRSPAGKLPEGLTGADFIVTEDNKRQQVTAVMRSTANVLLLLDASSDAVTPKRVGANRELALKIVNSLGADDQAAIITYADKVRLLSAWTKDKEALRHALDWQFRPGLKSRFYDAVLYAATEVLPKVSGRRSVVLVTDGIDSVDGDVFEESLIALHRARATVYVVSQTGMLIRELKPKVFHPLAWYEMIDPKVRKRYTILRRYVRDLEAAEVTLKGIAEETGGAFWNPRTSEEFQSISNRIVEEVGTEYVVAYSSERLPDDTSFHAVKVYVTRPDITIRSRRGIYSGLPVSARSGEAAREKH